MLIFITISGASLSDGAAHLSHKSTGVPDQCPHSATLPELYLELSKPCLLPKNLGYKLKQEGSTLGEGRHWNKMNSMEWKISDIPTIKRLYSASWKGKMCFLKYYWKLCQKKIIIIVCDWPWATMQTSSFHPLIYSLKHFLPNTHKTKPIKFIILQVSIRLCIGNCLKVNYKPIDLCFLVGVYTVRFHMGSRNKHNGKIPLSIAHNGASASGPAQTFHRAPGLVQGVPLCFYNLPAMKYGEFLPQWRRVVWFMACENIFLFKNIYLQLQTGRSCLEQGVSLFQERHRKISQIRNTCYPWRCFS